MLSAFSIMMGVTFGLDRNVGLIYSLSFWIGVITAEIGILAAVVGLLYNANKHLPLIGLCLNGFILFFFYSIFYQ